jgi:hypothetical protein
MGYGLLAGSVIGAVVGAPNTSQGGLVTCDDNYSFCTRHRVPGVSHLAGAIMGGLFGVAIGGVGGRFYRTERWIGRPLGNGSQVSVAPARRGAMAVRVSMRF